MAFRSFLCPTSYRLGKHRAQSFVWFVTQQTSQLLAMVHSYLQIQPYTVNEKPHVLTGKIPLIKSLVRMPRAVVC